jgi:hypothetical protein
LVLPICVAHGFPIIYPFKNTFWMFESKIFLGEPAQMRHVIKSLLLAWLYFDPAKGLQDSGGLLSFWLHVNECFRTTIQDHSFNKYLLRCGPNIMLRSQEYYGEQSRHIDECTA